MKSSVRRRGLPPWSSLREPTTKLTRGAVTPPPTATATAHTAPATAPPPPAPPAPRPVGARPRDAGGGAGLRGGGRGRALEVRGAGFVGGAETAGAPARRHGA